MVLNRLTIVIHSAEKEPEEEVWDDLCEVADLLAMDLSRLLVGLFAPDGQWHRPGLRIEIKV